MIAIMAMLASISAQGMLVLQPGEKVVFHVKDGRPVIDSPDMSSAPKDGLIATLSIDVPGGPKGTILVITSSGKGLLDYEAYISARGTSQRTSVCTLLGEGKPTFEHWPYPIDAISIGNFVPATGMRCR